MLAHAHRHHQIAVGAAVAACAALAADPQGLTVVDTGGDLHLGLEAAADFALALAAGAGGLDDLAGAAAVGTDAVGLHGHAHEALLGADRAPAVAAQTGLHRASRFGAAAAAAVAVFNTGGGDLLFCAEGGLLKGDFHPLADVLTPCGGVGAAAGGPSAAEEAAEQVAQVAEIAESAEGIAAGGACVEIRVYAGKAELVIAGALVGIGEDLVGLVDLLEFGLGVRLVVDVGVILGRQLAVCPLDLGLGSVLFDA